MVFPQLRLSTREVVDHVIKWSSLIGYGAKYKQTAISIVTIFTPANRKQCCKVNGKLSDLGKLTCGASQGSYLDPLLFIIYINDLPLSIKHSLVNVYGNYPFPLIAYPQ